MAYDDALFQLGMDLTRSSTAQKEDLGVTARVALDTGDVHGQHDTRHDEEEFHEDRSPVAGHHLIIDLMGGRRLDDLSFVERTLRRCVTAAGADVLHVHLHHTSPGGDVSGVVVLKDSHISIYTRPQAGYAALDVFMPEDAEPERVIPILRAAFGAREVQAKVMRRGGDHVRMDHSASIAAWPAPVQRETRAVPERERLRRTA